MAVKGIGSNYLYPAQNDYTLDSKTEDTKNVVSQTAVQKEGVSYEKTIPDSVSAGLEFIQGLEKQNSGTKFFVGTVSYGQTYGNSSDTNFVVNQKFLGKLRTDEATRKQFEEDVKYLNEFTKRFREQQLAQRRKIISQGWFYDENKAEEMAETEDTETSSEEESETISGKVGVNVGKTARKIAAAKTTSQLRAVIAEIKGDMQEVKAGIEKGWCDESEMEKVNSLMAQAQNRMGQVEDREATPEEENMFAMASLM